MLRRANFSNSTILREYFELVLIAFVLLNFGRVFLLQAFRIPSESMVPTLLVGDHILVNKFVYACPDCSMLPAQRIDRGDIIVFKAPERPSVKYVKRVIALPGDVVEIRSKRVVVNGTPLVESYATYGDARIFPSSSALPEPYRSRDQFGPFIVPADSYFVLGDNRDRSYDSRYWGCVPRAGILGRAFLIYWSFAGPQLSETTDDRLRELYYTITHFRTTSRWERTFQRIDNRYHEPELEQQRPIDVRHAH